MFRVPAAVCASRPPTQNTPPVRINTVKMTLRIFATPLAAHYTSLRTELNRLECVSPLYRGGLNMKLIGRSIIAGEPAPSFLPPGTPAAYFTARGALANFEEATAAHVNRAFEAS